MPAQPCPPYPPFPPFPPYPACPPFPPYPPYPPYPEQTAQSAPPPPSAPSSSSTGGGSNPSGSAGGDPAVNQGIAQTLAVANGHPSWITSQEWADWVQLWNDESSWNQDAVNSTSGAFGIAQALGHGTPGSGGTVVVGGSTHDEYGANYGLTTSEAVAANNGNASDQILWGIGYIAAVYGSPSAALAHENAFGWY
jgi:hypothetical protein